MQIKKLAVAAGLAGALGLSLLSAAPASADYNPSTGDFVGVGSDTLEFATGFVADGDHLGNTGYNAQGLINKIVDFMATPDANARLAYGPQGSGTSCAPGTGTNAGTGNATGNTTGNTVCTLNPTIVLRAGLKPIQRPNGSGDGTAALANDILAGAGNIDYARSSSDKNSTFTSGTYHRITIGTETLAMLSASTTNMPAAGLTQAQLESIYAASSPNCKKWTDVGGTSTEYIIPLVPQNGSGTRSFFLGQTGTANNGIGTSGSVTVGDCVTAVEENDPTAIYSVAKPSFASANVDANSKNAIEPMSGARNNLFNGINGAGTNNNGGTAVKYFQDESCKYGSASVTSGQGVASACGTATSSGSLATPVNLAPSTTFWGTQSGAWHPSRPLYIYFKAADMNARIQFQPGINLNKVRTVLANPCEGTSYTGVDLTTVKTSCSTISSVQYGPGGLPYYASSAGSALISSAGITTGYVYTS